ncbi:MAG: hypothetical protein WBA99_00370 [Nodosilinea sp.]
MTRFAIMRSSGSAGAPLNLRLDAEMGDRLSLKVVVCRRLILITDSILTPLAMMVTSPNARGHYEAVDHSGIPALAEIDLNLLSACILVGETSRIQAAQRLLAAHPARS